MVLMISFPDGTNDGGRIEHRGTNKWTTSMRTDKIKHHTQFHADCSEYEYVYVDNNIKLI